MTADVVGLSLCDGRVTERQKPVGDTSKKPLHIPLFKGGQLPRERRAVGAAKPAVGRSFRAPHPVYPDKQGILIPPIVEFFRKTTQIAISRCSNSGPKAEKRGQLPSAHGRLPPVLGEK